jgi:hypothetical protein
MIHNILHISDIHFTNEDDSYLKNSQQQFIDELAKEIESVESKIDYLFITGDFVERGEWEDKNYVIELLKKIETKLNIKNTFCVNGNHDLNEDGKVSENYKNVKNQLKTLKPDIDEDWFYATKISNNHWIVEFDCFSNGKRKVKLSDERDFKSLTDSQLDRFQEFINSELNVPSQNIYILSHLPVEINPSSKLLEDSNWKLRHLWKDGKHIFDMLRKSQNVNMLLWFAGDGHVVEAYKSPDFPYYFFLTGRFNGPIEKYGKDRDKEVAKEASCQFIRVDTIKANIIRTIKFSTFQERYEKNSLKWYSKSLDFVASTKNLNKFFSTNKKQIDLNNAILDAIGKDKLYRLAKATTKKKNVSLGWIDINGLLNHNNILKLFLEVTSDLLDNEYKSDYKNLIILGLGYWGGTIASFISLNKNIPSISIKVRGSNLTEQVDIIDMIKDKNIIIATDVVSSGETLEELREVFGIKDFSCLISVIFNPFLKNKLKGVDRIIYGSNQISLPIISRENLPESILTSDFDFKRI